MEEQSRRRWTGGGKQQEEVAEEKRKRKWWGGDKVELVEMEEGRSLPTSAWGTGATLKSSPWRASKMCWCLESGSSPVSIPE